MILIGIFVLALSLRLLHHHMDSTIARDGVWYVRMAEKWAECGNFGEMTEFYEGTGWVPPLMLWIMKTFIPFGVSPETTAVTLNILLGSLLPLIMFFIAKICTEKDEISIGAALIMAWHPPGIDMSIEVMRETLYLFLIGLAIICLLNSIKNNRWWQWGLGGFLLGLSCLTRYESFEFIILSIGYFGCSFIFKWLDLRKSLLFCASLLSGFILCGILVPYLMGIPIHHYAEKHQERIILYFFPKDKV